jgi:septal ring factor EnvC (AmiA/AmiB activator)
VKANDDLARIRVTDYEAKRAHLRAQKQANLQERVAIVKANIEEQEQYITLSAQLAKRRLDLIQVTADLKAIDDKIQQTTTDISDLEAGIIQGEYNPDTSITPWLTRCPQSRRKSRRRTRTVPRWTGYSGARPAA